MSKQELATETWKPFPIAGFSKYEVSNLGQVRSLKFGTKFIKLSSQTSGYKQAPVVGDDGKQKLLTVHRLVADAFLPPIRKHRDRIPETLWKSMAQLAGSCGLAERPDELVIALGDDRRFAEGLVPSEPDRISEVGDLALPGHCAGGETDFSRSENHETV